MTMTPSEAASLCSVLVSSCDQYSDLWRPFFTLFWRHWNCPFPVYLGSNTQEYRDGNVTTVSAGSSKSWTEDFRSYLDAIHSPYVIVLLEDFFLTGGVENPTVLSLLAEFANNGGNMLRLVPRPAPRVRASRKDVFGPCPPGAAYRVSLQATLWRIDVLRSLLQGTESAWEFEVRASERSNSYADGFYSVYRPVIPCRTHVVEKGEWFWSEARRYRDADIGCDFSRRRVMSFGRHAAIRWQRLCLSVFGLVSDQKRREIVAAIRSHRTLARFAEALLLR
jgi:hypothetical protein